MGSLREERGNKGNHYPEACPLDPQRSPSDPFLLSSFLWLFFQELEHLRSAHSKLSFAARYT